LRDKQIATNEELDRYLDHAADASSVKWRAASVRMEHLFAISSPSAQPKTEMNIRMTVTEGSGFFRNLPGSKRTPKNLPEKMSIFKSPVR
jgi:hypothetical protein